MLNLAIGFEISLVVVAGLQALDFYPALLNALGLAVIDVSHWPLAYEIIEDVAFCIEAVDLIGHRGLLPHAAVDFLDIELILGSPHWPPAIEFYPGFVGPWPYKSI